MVLIVGLYKGTGKVFIYITMNDSYRLIQPSSVFQDAKFNPVSYQVHQSRAAVTNGAAGSWACTGSVTGRRVGIQGFSGS